MNLLKILIPAIIVKKIYSKPYYAAKKPKLSDAEQDAIDDAKADS